MLVQMSKREDENIFAFITVFKFTIKYVEILPFKNMNLLQKLPPYLSKKTPFPILSKQKETNKTSTSPPSEKYCKLWTEGLGPRPLNKSNFFKSKNDVEKTGLQICF